MNFLHALAKNRKTAVFSALAGLLFARQPLSAQTGIDQPVRILEQHRVWARDHLVVYNRIAPPAPRLTLQQTGPSSESAPLLQAREQKAFRMVVLGATTYDGQYTDLRWSDGDQWVRAISNVDFKYFTGFAEFETIDTVYELVIMSSQEASAGIPSGSLLFNWINQARLNLPQTSSGYLVVEGNATADPSALSDLDALHSYFDASKDRLVQAHQQRQLELQIQLSRLSTQQPSPKPPTTINFWPIKSQLWNAGGQQ